MKKFEDKKSALSRNANSNGEHENIWTEKPRMVKQFIENRPDYERLCAEVAYILSRTLKNACIEFSAITHRAKTLDSFLEKIQRKTYDDPIKRITDFAGVRVVCLYVDDLLKIENIVSEHFEVIEKIDKSNDKKIDNFGYGAIHFVVRLGKNSSGARYDDLKNLVCEIQIRTVLQDAWAIIDHHLVYKNEMNVPSVLRKKLHLLSETFESADEEFQQIRKERQEYLFEIEESEISPEQFLENELNLDSFVRYAQWKFPVLPSGTNVVDAPFFLDPILKSGFQKLYDLDAAVQKGIKIYDQYVAQKGRDFFNSNAITSVVAALFFVNKNFTPAEHINQLFPKYAEFARTQRLFDKEFLT